MITAPPLLIATGETSFSRLGALQAIQAIPANNTLYVDEIEISQAAAIAGVQIATGATASGDLLVALYGATGLLVAQSVATAQTSPWELQAVPFTAPYNATRARYLLAMIASDAAATFGLHASFGNSAAYPQGGFSLPPSIVPPTGYNATYVPQMSTY